MSGNEADDDPFELLPFEEEPRALAPPPPEEPGPGSGQVSDEPVRTPTRVEAERRAAKARPVPVPGEAGLLAILGWPLRGESGQRFAAALAIFGLGLLAGAAAHWLVALLPDPGPQLGAFFRTVLALAGAVFLLEYASQLSTGVLRDGLPAERILTVGLPREGLRLVVVLLLWMVPAVILGLWSGVAFVGAIPGAAAAAGLPAAWLNAAASGRIFEGHPFVAVRIARAVGRRWWWTVGPAAALGIARTFSGSGATGLALEAATGVAAAYGLYLAAILVRGNPAARAAVEESAA